jgi:hypothetical protein
VLDAHGTPRASGKAIANQNLHFCGFYISRTGMLREIALEVRAICDDLTKRA